MIKPKEIGYRDNSPLEPSKKFPPTAVSDGDFVVVTFEHDVRDFFRKSAAYAVEQISSPCKDDGPYTTVCVWLKQGKLDVLEYECPTEEDAKELVSQIMSTIKYNK